MEQRWTNRDLNWLASNFNLYSDHRILYGGAGICHAYCGRNLLLGIRAW